MRVAAYLPFALILAYIPIFLGQIIYSRDLIRWVYPARAFVRACIERREWPFWNSTIGLGFSVLTDPLYGLFYPPNLFYQLGPLAHAVMLVFFLHLLAGAVGAMILARLFDLRPIPALVVGLGWGLSGYTASLWTLGILLPASAWVPWIGVGFVNLARRQFLLKSSTRAIVLLAAVIAGSILLGEFFVTAMGILSGACLAVVWRFGTSMSQPTCPPNPRGWHRLFMGGMAGMLLGIAMGAVAIIPAILGISSTERSQPFSLEVALNWSVHPARMLGFVTGDFWGKAWEYNPTATWAKTILDGRPLGINLYLGGSIVALAMLGLRWPQRHPNADTRRANWWALGIFTVGIIFLLLALGRHTPLWSWIRVVVPPFSHMRSPEKFLIPFLPMVVLLAGFGAQRLLYEVNQTPLLRLAIFASALGAIAHLAPWFSPSDLSGYIRQGALHGCVASAAIFAVAILNRRESLVSYLIVIVVSADLTYGLFGMLRYGEASIIGQVPTLAAAIPNRGVNPTRPIPRLFIGTAVEDSVIRSGSQTAELRVIAMLRNNIGTLHGLANIPGYEAALPPEQAELLANGRRDALRLAAIDYALLSGRSKEVPEDLTLLSEGVAGIRLHQVKNVLPRAFLAFSSTSGTRKEIASHLLDPDVVSGQRVWLEEVSPREVKIADTAPVPCTFEHIENRKLRIKCTANQPALAVFVEQFASGWRATVDGQSAQIFRANTFMRAVPIPTGTHIIEMTFWPPGLSEGIFISLLGLVLSAFLAKRKPTRVPQVEPPS